MKEDFLHYIWKFKKFSSFEMTTTSGEAVTVIAAGQYLELAGPDFFNAQVTIGDQKWAGNVEIHVKSSDWYLHHHEQDPAYENVILHVVWEHDTEIFRKNNSTIPVLELKNYVDAQTVQNYTSLLQPKSWIFCEKQLSSIPHFIIDNWKERLFFERLDRKATPIFAFLDQSQNDWEATLFWLLAKNFGLNTNGDIFLRMAQSIPFSIIRKERLELANLEALFFGLLGLLEPEHEDAYFKDLKFRFLYLVHKYNLDPRVEGTVQFFKHRPDNFPTVRLSQLAQLYHQNANLFELLMQVQTIEKWYQLFEISASSFWDLHYQFDKNSIKRTKKLSKSFIDLLLINTIIPMQFAYEKSRGGEASDNLLTIMEGIAAEKNAIITKFSSFRIDACNAFDSQALLQLKNEYCNKSKCLECAIGVDLIKGSL
ncbi:DUF2851 family protein [Flavobacterium sp. F-328]|uniref:DUF2851 family protein n=1 Tax=Flavobacterium erciyesense TaxID=2825842 RepID=A0ABS5D1M5_9FLAO|nr:DUF2851 family protein [Flavobacterium erciyesense]MBQ0907895.1 DUF2851 family protein [Flavobacterium erciyesense]